MRRGTRVGQAYVALAVDGSGVNEEIVDSVDDAGPGVEDAGEEHGRRYSEGFDRGSRSRMGRIFDRVSSAARRRFDDAGTDSGDSFSESFGERVTQRARAVADRASQALGDRMAYRPEAVRRGIDRAFDDEFADRIGNRLGDRIGHSMLENLMAAMARRGDYDREFNPIADLIDRWMDDAVSGNRGGGRRSGNRGGLSDIVGRMFGAGSRNNALNFLGKSMSNVVRLTEKASQFASGFAKGISEAGEGASLFQKFLGGMRGGGAASGLTGALRGIAAAGPAAGAAGAAVLVVLSALVSVIGALIGIITAFISTIVSGLVGALAVAGSAIMAVVAAGGLLTAAFMSMTDAQREMLTTAFQPLKAEMVGIGQLMLRDMVPAFSIWSQNLQKALQLLAPVANVMGTAFAQAGTQLTAAFSGPGFQAFANALGVYLPSIVTRLSNALGGFLNGLMGMFAVIMPYVNQFAGYLQQVATRFSNWANSATGQNAIADFVARAVESLKSLWGFIREFSGFVSDVLFNPAAQQAGNTIFDGLRNAFEGFRAAIASGDLERWFTDAINFGSQLWGVIQALGGTFIALYNSGVLEGIGYGLETMANVINVLNAVLTPLIDLIGYGLPAAIALVHTPINLAMSAIMGLVNSLRQMGNWLSKVPGLGFLDSGDIDWSSATDPLNTIKDQWTGAFTNPNTSTSSTPSISIPNFTGSSPSLGSLINSGNSALNQTSQQFGGYKPPAQYVNPYKNWANSLIKEGPSIRQQIVQAINKVNKEIFKGVRDAQDAATKKEARQNLKSLAQSIKQTAKSTVEAARNQLNSAARELANASSQSAASAALANVRRAQADLRKARKAQDRIQKAARMLGRQRSVRPQRVNALVRGAERQNATLAEYAAARNRVANKLEKANQKLVDAIAVRNEYRQAVTDSVREFGSLLTAEAKVIDGVEQALTATDITDNLEDRLQKIRDFQSNLHLLLSMGLSQDAYKQLVDAGVEQGGAYAQALVEGGYGSVQHLNNLVSDINKEATALGKDASNRMYQAGVDAARGLVEGLESLSAQLDSAAARLGNKIAKSIQRALGIKSPSRVMMSMMDDVGDGAVIGLDNQGPKVSNAAARLAGQIAVSPEVAQYAARHGASPTTESGAGVSGNDPKFLWTGDIVTPTEDPGAVANEVLNELTGRL